MGVLDVARKEGTSAVRMSLLNPLDIKGPSSDVMAVCQLPIH